MKFQIEQKELIKHIQYLASIAPTKNTSPILTNYLLEVNADTNLIRIITSDLELTVVAEFAANVTESGITTVNARYFNEIISSMPEKPIDIYTEEEIVRIKCGKIDFSLLSADYTLFPLVPEINLQKALVLSSENFFRMLAKTSFAVSNDINRAVLNGVCWQIKTDSQLMCGTDGRKVAEIIIRQPLIIKEKTHDTNASASELSDAQELITEDLNLTQPDFEKGIEKILPFKTIGFLQKINTPELKEINAVIEPNRITFVYGDYTIFTHVIEHKFPDYQKAFIKDLPNTLLIKKNTLITAIKRVAIEAPEDNERIRFEISNGNFEINTTNRETGEGKEILENFEYTGTDTAISFNNKYMLSILDVIDTERVKICLGTSKDPIMIYNETQPENQEITFLLMPLRS